MASCPESSEETTHTDQSATSSAQATSLVDNFRPRLRAETDTGRLAKCVSFDLMVRLISATFSQYLVRGAVLTLPLALAVTGSVGCANPVPFALPTAGADGVGGDPNASGGATDFGGSPAAGGDDGSAGSLVAGGDTSSGGDSSGGATSSAGASSTFGGAPSAGGSSSAGASAGGKTGGGSAGKSGAGGSGTAGSTGSAGAAAAGAPSAGASSGGATGGGSCAAAYANGACLNLNVGTQVSSSGHNWTCNDANCRNCATYPACAPGASACPWGAVWTDNGSCN